MQRNPSSKLSHLGHLKSQHGGKVVITPRDLSNYFREVTRGMRSLVTPVARAVRGKTVRATTYKLRVGNATARPVFTDFNEAKKAAKAMAVKTGQRVAVVDKASNIPLGDVQPTVKGGRMHVGEFARNPTVKFTIKKERTGYGVYKGKLLVARALTIPQAQRAITTLTAAKSLNVRGMKRNPARKRRPYYMLFEFENGRWGPQFGDFDKETVEYERRDLIDGYQAIKPKNLKIVRLPSSDRRDMEPVLARLNLSS